MTTKEAIHMVRYQVPLTDLLICSCFPKICRDISMNMYWTIVCNDFSGCSVEGHSVELAKLKSLSSRIYKDELLTAAQNTFCHRRFVIDMKKPTFASCVSQSPCYATLPQIVSTVEHQLHFVDKPKLWLSRYCWFLFCFAWKRYLWNSSNNWCYFMFDRLSWFQLHFI